jgi:hypothetical protein
MAGAESSPGRAEQDPSSPICCRAPPDDELDTPPRLRAVARDSEGKVLLVGALPVLAVGTVVSGPL